MMRAQEEDVKKLLTESVRKGGKGNLPPTPPVIIFQRNGHRFQQYYAWSGQLGIDRAKFNVYYKNPARLNVFLQTRHVTEIVTE